MRIEIAGYRHPDAKRLIEDLQQVYLDRYGEEDRTPVDPGDFEPPRGLFLLGYLEGCAVASGGWRVLDSGQPGFRDGDVELKRMYTAPEVRGRGLSRLMLAELEARAAVAGHRRIVLETGTRQPEAIGLYASSGYREIEKFGVYRHDPDSVCLGKTI
ncbi:acetyltransferase (GNAT) family protein [Saccharopolyspora erythraea NRRL 2338]|uniref:Acetyltransferase n=2 Tax=Saccharopolyspora erythraea TaxID=1836 RepID=A4FN21_SACEN|nr:GNAT family N-acetyltransferase [Saccharopolyspora erythraea]EQD82587.1 acetyltransferase [Saccharopolyspora erythraea D]PFG99087.1 acetyltransferase (GNAT) family protein [Saccharopolyspora erythraea NRRL 2338]QRK89048.1 GNAT family N-acetyltransferase [Saccharopolyspora erythraea]CAM05446.1 acetyltransferase [Saccharopolyspora erythraea NRRL 2338]